KNANVTLDSASTADLKGGQADPRVLAVITQLSHEHKLTVSLSDRGADITAIDGQPGGPDNPIARDVAGELSGLDSSIRPSQIGSPWSIAGSGYYTDTS